MALLGFSMIPIFYYLQEQVTLWLRNPRQSERERVHLEEEKEKSPKNHCAMAENQTHDLSLLSRVLYPLDHGALPTIRGFDG